MDELTRCALAARDGDQAALGRFVRLSQADVWRLAAHLVDRDEADDITQEVYERALRSLANFRGEASARTWLLTIARRTCVDAIRRRTRVRVRDGRLRVLAEDRAAHDVDGLPLLVQEALAVLDQDRRSAFVLTQFLGYGYAEAAEICGCPVGTIRSRVARARAELLAGWESDGEVVDEDLKTSNGDAHNA